MSFWDSVKAGLQGLAEGMDPNTHYQTGYEHGQQNLQPKQYRPDHFISNPSLHANEIACQNAYNRGYAEGQQSRAHAVACARCGRTPTSMRPICCNKLLCGPCFEGGLTLIAGNRYKYRCPMCFKNREIDFDNLPKSG